MSNDTHTAALLVLEDGLKEPLISRESEETSTSSSKKENTWYDAAFHNMTAMVGAGVLGLPSTFAVLGWHGGLIVLFGSLMISWYTFSLLVHLHEGQDEKGEARRYNRYHELCQAAYGKVRGVWAILSFQLPFLYGLAVTYSVTGALNLASFAALVYTNGASKDPNFFFHQSYWIIIFSGVEILIAQLPDLGSLGWVSGVGAIMSILYSVGGSALSFHSALPRDQVNYDPGSVQCNQQTYRVVLSVFSSITTIFFAFGGHNIALEIQSILPHPPCTVRPMMRGVHVAFVLTILCYLLVSVTGFYSFGTAVKGNILDSAEAAPLGLLALCYLAVVFHVLASYQVYSFPIFDLVETELDGIAQPAAPADSLDPEPPKPGPIGRVLRFIGPTVRRQLIRVAYVASTCLIACLVPFFEDLMGLIGAVGATPTTFVIPCLLWLEIKRPKPLVSLQWWLCWVIAIVSSCIGLMGAAGAVYNLIEDSKTYQLFGG